MIHVYTNFKNINFSQFILGTVQLGLDYGISNTLGKPTFTQGINILSYAAEQGINTLDTARQYGSSEEVIGKFIRIGDNRAPINLISKFVIPASAESDFESCWTQVLLSVRNSVNLLGVRRLTGCLFHRSPANNLDRIAEFLPVIFDRLKELDLIELGGFSAYYPKDIPYVLEVPQIEIVQVPFNLFDQRLLQRGLLSAMKAQHKLVVARSIFLQGLFFLTPSELDGAMAVAAKYLVRLRAFCLEHDLNLSQLALAFVRDQIDIDCLVIGALNVSQVRENINLLESPALTPSMMDLIKTSLPVDEEFIVTPGLWPTNTQSGSGLKRKPTGS